MQTTLEAIMTSFPVTNAEYELLDQRFGKLAHYAAWELKRKNNKNANVNDPDDDVQSLRIALVKAGCYYKRQTYIERCFEVLEGKITDSLVVKVFEELKQLWHDRRRHGANRQKFGSYQQVILDQLISQYISKENRPKKDEPLKLDLKFATYCKQIIWNEQKALGKKITKEKSWRTGLISLSDFDYLSVAV